MDSAMSAQDQRLFSAIHRGMQELAASLPIQFQPMGKPIMALVSQQVASASPRDLRTFLEEARDKIDGLLRGETEVVIEAAPVLPALAASPDVDPLGELTSGEWWCPTTKSYTIRRPVVEDLLAVSAAIEADPEPAEKEALEETGAYLLAYFEGEESRESRR